MEKYHQKNTRVKNNQDVPTNCPLTL